MDIMDTIREQIEGNRVILYMKGSPNQPQCGFSARTVQALMSCGERFAYVDVLSNPEIRANLPAYANWPTFPQLWVDGELVGGCDIVQEMMGNGELYEALGLEPVEVVQPKITVSDVAAQALAGAAAELLRLLAAAHLLLGGEVERLARLVGRVVRLAEAARVALAELRAAGGRAETLRRCARREAGLRR